MSEAMWMDEVEAIGELLSRGAISREHAIRDWMHLGLNEDDAHYHADDAEAGE